MRKRGYRNFSRSSRNYKKKKVRYKEEDIKESNVANPGVSGLSHLYLGNFFYLKSFDHHQMVDW